MPIPPGVDLDATEDVVVDAPGLDAYDDAAADPGPEIALDPSDEPVNDADIGDPAADATEETEDDAEDDVEEDAGDEDGPDVT